MSENSVVCSDDECNFQNVLHTHMEFQCAGKKIWPVYRLNIRVWCTIVHQHLRLIYLDLSRTLSYKKDRSDPAISTWMINVSVCLFIHGQIIRKSCRRQCVFLSRPVTPLSSYLINQLIKGDQLSMSFAVTFSIFFLYKI